MRALILDLDTLRPDHLGCYGYHRDTSPQIDEIAGEGMRFTNYHCSDAPCLPSRAALLTGRFGIHTGVVGHGGTAADMRAYGAPRDFRDPLDDEGLFAIFRRHGMRVASISPFAERHSAWWFTAGCNEVYNTGKGGLESGEEVLPVALDWIERHGASDDWCLHINFWDPHTPYRAPASFGDPFAADPLPDWITPDVIAAHQAMAGPHGAQEVSMFDDREDPAFPRHPGRVPDMAGARRMIDGYDCGIRFMDDCIRGIVDALKARGVYDDMLVIVTSDHGENLGELGIWGEHATADAITPHIPMLVRWPGHVRAGVDDGIRLNLDLAPTLAEMLGQPRRARWDGASYAAALTGAGIDARRESAVLSQCAHVCQRSVRFGDWIYVRTIHDGFHLFPREMLFDVANDPHEQRDLAAERPDACAEGARHLANWHEDMILSSDTDVDPLYTVLREGGPYHARGNGRRYAEYLRRTGRAAHADRLERAHPEEFR